MADPSSVLGRIPNLILPTMGGKQLWGDVFLHAGYRIQENVYTHHHRLLGPTDVRLAWGTWDECHQAFARIKEQRRVEPPSDHLVLLLHGIFRSKDSFGPMTRALRRAGYDASGVNYPSTRRTLSAHAEQVELLLDRAEGVRTVSFVTHSMGGMVARVLLARQGAWRKHIEVNRLVMIATPNRGAEMVRRLHGLSPFRAVAGPAIAELLPERVDAVPAPSVPFGLIAGAKGDGRGYNPLLQGDDDMTVSLASTQLDSAEDTLVVNAIHTFIMVKPAVIQATIAYLQNGRFQTQSDAEGASTSTLS